ncbi:hypothetical protein [Streptosporangium sp. NPDC000396]|uniref:hypothetical protein n=1 Tax=Streptosporangium sp. NPDC000396 TaxID=3366185 RepID=UPI00368CB2E4
MYHLMIDKGAPLQKEAKEDGDQKRPCMMAWLTRSVNSLRRQWEQTPFGLLTGLPMATVGGKHQTETTCLPRLFA